MSNQTTALSTTHETGIMEQVLIAGDLSKLTPQQRVEYYMQTCKSLGLNPLTRPFDYINLSGKLTLYPKKDATEQLRKTNGISIDKPELQFEDDLLIVTVTGQDKTGRRDTDVGAVTIGTLKGDAKANAVMKAITKAKRRLTLSICGLGWIDESELETIPDARPVVVSEQGEIIDGTVVDQPPAPPAPQNGGHLVGRQAGPEAWDKWHTLVNEAVSLGIVIYEPAADCTVDELRAAYGKLRQEIKEYQIARMNGETEEG